MLQPSIFTSQEISAAGQVTPRKPLKTYKFDFVTGEFVDQFIDLDDAVRQLVEKSIKTARNKYAIYSSDYGCEIYYLIGTNYSNDYLNIEVPRLIREALMIFDVIKEVTNFVINRSPTTDVLNVSFEVITNLGENIPVEVTV